MPLPVIQPARVTLMIKPMGAVCNLDCDYCYYLPTQVLYGGREKRMTDQTLESVFASAMPNFADEVTIAWQGGEPTLAGLDFFERAIQYQDRYRRVGQRVGHALQTNGTMLDDAWCKFLARHGFLVGLSLDGPPHLHDHYRTTRGGHGSHDRVLRGLHLMRKHGVEHNILCVLNDRNVHHPDEVFKYLLNLGPRHLQFIPAIEWVQDPDDPRERTLAPFSPASEDYGRFLCRVFDLWYDRYRTQVSIRFFDAVLNKLVHGHSVYCITAEACHNQVTIEHDGSVFGCDHFVEPRWRLGRIGEPDWHNPVGLGGEYRTPLFLHGKALTDACHDDDEPRLDGTAAATNDPAKHGASFVDDAWFGRTDQHRLGAFAMRKSDLPKSCMSCEYKAYCYGGCPKHRAHGGDTTEKTALCAGYQMFFAHALPRLRELAGYLRQGVAPPPPEAIQRHASRPTPRPAAVGAGAAVGGGSGRVAAPRSVGRNDPCPCGSGMKFKKCCGR